MNKKLVTAISAAAAALCVGVGVYAASSRYGTEDDPLITRSYLDETLTPQIISMVDSELASVSAGSAGTAESGSFEPVELCAGDTLFCAVGCEILPRSGSAQVLSGAFADTTSGSELGSGALPRNHLCMAVSPDCCLSAAEDCLVLVCGSYEIG